MGRRLSLFEPLLRLDSQEFVHADLDLVTWAEAVGTQVVLVMTGHLVVVLATTSVATPTHLLHEIEASARRSRTHGIDLHGVRVDGWGSRGGGHVCFHTMPTLFLLALAQALKEGRIGGAALDVFGTEPLPASPHFEGCPNLILTPHVAGVTAEANERVSFLIADKVLEALA